MALCPTGGIKNLFFDSEFLGLSKIPISGGDFSSHYKKTALTFNLAIMYCIKAYSLTG